jgi:hypothetical protein
MIPSFKQIKKKSNPIEKKEYFALTEEYRTLQKKFEVTGFELFFLVVDLFVYPLYMIYQISEGDNSYMHIFAAMKTYELWSDLLRYLELTVETDLWILLVKLAGGPWISTNDPDYHLFVYADAMERIYLSHTTQAVCQKID